MFRSNGDGGLHTSGLCALEMSVACGYDRAAVLFARGVYGGAFSRSKADSAFEALWAACGSGAGRLFGAVEALLALFFVQGFGCQASVAHAERMALAAAMYGN